MASKIFICRRTTTFLPTFNHFVKYFSENSSNLIKRIPASEFITPNISETSKLANDLNLQSLVGAPNSSKLINKKISELYSSIEVNLTPSSLDCLECVAHECSEYFIKEFVDLFPDRNLVDGLTIVTLSQKTKNDMSSWNEAVENEREQLLEKFVEGAKEICLALKSAGYWADFVEPSSGLPYFGAHTNSPMFETDSRYNQLGFEIEDLGCCKVIRHKLWFTHAYVGTLFTDASLDTLILKNIVS